MIGIKNYVEDGLEMKHYQNIKDYLKGIIKFYLNCIAIINGDLAIDEFENDINLETDYRCYNSWFSIIFAGDNTFKQVVDTGNLNLDQIKSEFNDIKTELQSLLVSFLDSDHILHIENIITSDPSVHDEIIEEFDKFYFNISINTQNSENDNKLFDMILNKIFDYEKFVKGSGYFKNWNAYDLAEKLDVNVCPYCNRLYTSTINSNNSKITRPEFDHYLTKSKHPYLALSFFNLIPSCKVCNSQLKKGEELPLDTKHHPYLKNDNKQPIFSFDLNNIDVFSGKSKDLEVIFNKKSAGISFDGKLQKIYNGHSDIVADLVYKRHIYSDELVDEINQLIPDDNISKKEVIRTLFAMPINEKEIVNLSLGKLKTDIMKELFNL